MEDFFTKICKRAIYIGGPGISQAIVFNLSDIEPTIELLARLHGYDVDDYTATDLNNPKVQP